MLSEKQNEVFGTIKEGHNVIVMGSGGTGKSFIIKEIEKWGKELNIFVAKTAMTGVAAVLLGEGGCTINSFLGIGIANELPEFYISKLKKSSNKAGENIRNCEILLIDEFSMMSLFFLKLIMRVIEGVRGKRKPLQIVLFGDPKQLSPVFNDREDTDEDKKRYCFEGLFYLRYFEKVFVLKENFRQTDKQYAADLEKIGIGEMNDSIRKRLESCISPRDLSKDVVHLYSTNEGADFHNTYKMERLKTHLHVYEYFDIFEHSIEESHIPEYIKTNALAKLARTSRFQEPIEVKKGMLSMCMVNVDIEKGWANGTTGLVVGFKVETDDFNQKTDAFPVVCKDIEKGKRYISGECKTLDKDFRVFQPTTIDIVPVKGFGNAIRRGIPLKPAWGVTIHKCQGNAFDEVYLASNDVSRNGQAYVALSRVKTLKGLKLISVPEVNADKRALDFINEWS
jgi:ATP-dependent DNA helicase PIF1